MVSWPGESKFPKVGAVVRFNGGTKNLQFRGQNEDGRIVLKDATSGIRYLVQPEDIYWNHTKKAKAKRP